MKEFQCGEAQILIMDDGAENALLMLMASVLAMEPAKRVLSLARVSGNGHVTQKVQAFLYNSCLNHSIARKFPPSKAYVHNLLKHVILAAEGEGEEVMDVLYQEHVSSSSSFNINSHEKYPGEEMETPGNHVDRCYKSYLYLISEDLITKLIGCIGSEDASKFTDTMILTLRVSSNMLEGSTGCYVWPAGLFLSEFLLANPHIFTGRCCLEVGTGAGLSSLCLAQLKASKVIATDGNPSAMANLKHNFLINGILLNDEHNNAKVEFRELVWETATEDEVKSFNADIIIGADVIYNPVCVPHLIRLLSWFLLKHRQDGDPSGVSESMPIAFIATVIRNVETLNMFISLAHLSGLVVEDISESMRPPVLLPQLTNIDRSRICLHKVKGK